MSPRSPRDDSSLHDRWSPAWVELEQPLLDLAELAARSVPGVDGAGVTLLDDGIPVFRSSNGYAQTIDRFQYRINEGPCVDAVAQACTVVTGTIGNGEQRWPRFGQRARTLQVRSVLSVPLVVGDHVIGSVNMYGRRVDAFDAESVTAGERFAGPAAVSLSSAQLLVETIDVADFTGYDLADRARIETAVGVLSVLHHLTVDDARTHLISAATASGTALKAAADQVLTDLVGRAQ